jgi:4-hydroxybutyrate CoA-transferase
MRYHQSSNSSYQWENAMIAVEPPRLDEVASRQAPAWLHQYRARTTSAEAAVHRIRPGSRVFMSGMGSVPQVLLRALIDNAADLHDVEIIQVLPITKTSYPAPELDRHLRFNTLFISPGLRSAVNHGLVDYTPIFLSEIPDLCRRELNLDTAIIQVSPPDADGFCSFGLEFGVSRPAAFAAATVIAEVNPQMPRTLGESFIHISRLNHIVEVDYAPPELPMSDGGPIETAIGRIIAEMIEDGSTLQMGIGGIPDGVLRALRTSGVRDLGIHTEMFSDGVIDLVELGLITNARKTLHPGKIIAGFMLGSRRLHQFVHNNDLIEMHPIDYVNDLFIIAQNEKMVAINAAIEVDLTGQVCADSIGHQFYSGVGGQVDFIRGAARSKGGKPIITLPSTAQGETCSRIVGALKTGAGVTTSRNDVHYVITEYGCAYLHGKSIRQRAQALISIAHPKFREQLTLRARELNYI